MRQKILLVKESAPGEARVSLIPTDVQQLIDQGNEVYVEAGAGVLAGFGDEDYVKAGAQIRKNDDDYQKLFADISLLVRAKRPNREREQLEAKALSENMIIMGALDPFAKDGHIEEYRKANVTAFSIDQVPLPKDSPMNILATMSHIAGELALLDAINKSKNNDIKNVLIIGTGTAGIAAYNKAIEMGYQVTIMSSNAALVNEYQSKTNTRAVYLDKNVDVFSQQQLVKENASDANIVITAARSAGKVATILFPVTTLRDMLAGTVIVDLALSEGGNVAGSLHDQTVTLGNGIMVTNVSGYPKVMPHEASIKWSLATRMFIEALNEPSQKSMVTAAKI